jgi:hypothetical protein
MELKSSGKTILIYQPSIICVHLSIGFASSNIIQHCYNECSIVTILPYVKNQTTIFFTLYDEVMAPMQIICYVLQLYKVPNTMVFKRHFVVVYVKSWDNFVFSIKKLTNFAN